jgi:hypothetical protein
MADERYALNAKAALKGASEFGGPVVLTAGAAMVALALVGFGRDHYRVVVAPPYPAVTVTTTQTSNTTSSTPSNASTTLTHEAGSTAVTVAEPRGATIRKPRPDPGAPSGPAPHPTRTAEPPAATSCGGQVLTVRTLRTAACASIGVSK